MGADVDDLSYNVAVLVRAAREEDVHGPNGVFEGCPVEGGVAVSIDVGTSAGGLGIVSYVLAALMVVIVIGLVLE